MTAMRSQPATRAGHHCGWTPSGRGFRWGVLAAAGLLAFYGMVIAVASSIGHLRAQLALDWPWVTAIVVGFGSQVALLVTLRERQRARAAAAAAGTGAGASVVGMLACCAHHLAEIAPLVGVNLVATFLASYRVPIMAVGIAVNAVAIAVTVRKLLHLDDRAGHEDLQCAV